MTTITFPHGATGNITTIEDVKRITIWGVHLAYICADGRGSGLVLDQLDWVNIVDVSE